MIATLRSLAVLACLGGCAGNGREPSVPPAAGPVEIHWDAWQVPHVFAADRAGIAYGLGWAQLRAYPEEIPRLYALARGEAASIWGAESLRSDRLMRTLGVPQQAVQSLASRSAETRAQLEAFAKGMNDFAAAHPERLSGEARAVLPVRPEDALAHGHRILLAFTLLTGARPMVLGVDGEVMPTLAGSNTWAIGPSRSASGHPLLLANPHLPWYPPALRFFEAHLVGPDAPLYGCALLGFPGVSIGFNDAMAWSHTVNVLDTADYFALVPAGKGYRFDGRERAYDEHTEMIAVRGKSGAMTQESLVIRRSVHGPVLTLKDGGLIAVRTGMDDAAGEWMESWSKLGRARDLATFEGTLRELGLPMFTVSYADRDGHIFYLSAGRVPKRASVAEGWIAPVRGDTSALLWDSLMPYESLPRVVDPASGFVQNSNSVPWFATMPGLDPAQYRELGIPDGPLNMREIHGLRLVSSDPSITFDELRSMQHSTRLELADHVLDDLLAAASKNDRAEVVRARALLAAWDRTTTGVGAVLFEAWANRAFAKGGFAEPWSATQPLETPRGLADPAGAIAALEAAAGDVVKRFGKLDATWAEVHRLRDDLGGVGASGNLGSFHVIDYASEAGGAMRPVAGDTFVAIVELRPEGPRAEVLLTYGNASPSSPFAKDQLELLAAGKLRVPLLVRAEIEKAAVEHVRLERP